MVPRTHPGIIPIPAFRSMDVKLLWPRLTNERFCAAIVETRDSLLRVNLINGTRDRIISGG